MDVHNEVFTAELIQLAWKKSGIWPMNPNRFTEKDFAPSKLMSYATCLPVGYPEVPNVPDMLMFGPGSDEDKGIDDEVGGDDNRLMDEMSDEEMDNDDEMDEEGMNSDEKDDKVDEGDGEDNEIDDETGKTDGDVDDGIADKGMNIDDKGEELVDETSEDATMGQGTNTLSNAGHLSRYKRESYCLK